MNKRFVRAVFAAFLAASGVVEISDRVAPTPDLAAQEPAAPAEKIGVRPYEMDWAGRTKDDYPPLVDFENLDGWTVRATNSVATFERSREERLFGDYVGKLTYRATTSEDGKAVGTPIVDVRPPEPIPISPSDFDAFSCWIVGNNWAWESDPTTPRVLVSTLFQGADGTEVAFPTETVRWREWFLTHQVLTASWRERLAGAAFAGFRIENGWNVEDRAIYFDSFCCFKEKKPALEFKLRAKPGIELFPGQPLGINAGEGRLPFPTRDETILPDSAKNLRKSAFHKYGDSFDFVYEGSDGTLVFEYRPKKGDWSDVSARWNDSKPFRPLDGGGITTLVGENGDEEPVEKFELISAKADENSKLPGVFGPSVLSRWKLTSKTAVAEVEYRFQLQGKSLIVDTIALGGKVAKVGFGGIVGIEKPKTILIPFYMYDYAKRPGVALFGVPSKKDDVPATPLFASGHVDWYRSGASYLFGTNGVEVADDKSARAVVNGAAEYRTKDDGTRNDVYERFFVTVSPEFAETLPTIANPASPYKHIAGKGVWNARGATTREGDKKFWREIWRAGIRNAIVTDHEVCWRDGGESFTFRTKPAPKKGGDAGWADFSRFMNDELGFVYGPYNNFTDFAPVNEYWSADMVGRLSDGTLQHAWARCYAPKPTRAVEYCEKLTPIVQEKFRFRCAYCDVHSSVPPWTRTDYDSRVPGAGTLASVFYPYGEIFLIQKKNWGGPTYSEGPHHAFYAGLTDGNYGQDQPYNLRINPWLVDFELLKIHDLECDFGLGNVGMFAPGYRPRTPEERVALLDRFLCGTLAFGRSGFLATEYGTSGAAKSYFAIQQIAARYTQTSVASIRYFAADGTALDTSAALIADVVKRNQIEVRFQDGTVVFANGSEKENLVVAAPNGDRQIVLPPNGYVAWTEDGAVFVESALSENGARFDYFASPEYIYFDGRDAWTNREKASGKGVAVLRFLTGKEKKRGEKDDEYELIPFEGSSPLDVGFKIGDGSQTVSAVALNEDGAEIGVANVRYSRGFVFVEPVGGAFSYRLTVAADASDAPILSGKTDDRFYVAPGEIVSVGGSPSTIPPDAAESRVWSEPNADAPGAFRDFWVVPALDVKFSFDSKRNALTAGASTRLDGTEALRASARLVFGDQTTDLNAKSLQKGASADFVFELPPPIGEGSESAVFATTALLQGDQNFGLSFPLNFETTLKFVALPAFDFGANSNRPGGAVSRTEYVQRRGSEATRSLAATGAQAFFADGIECGGVAKSGFNLHPPYQNGPTGRAFLRFDFSVPDEPTAFRAVVGKRDGSDFGDGILYQIAVAEFDDSGKIVSEKTLAEKTQIEHSWIPIEADLTEYAGKSVSLLVVADVGVKNDSGGDWACVADLRLESAQKTLIRELK